MLSEERLQIQRKKIFYEKRGLQGRWNYCYQYQLKM